MNSWPPIPMHNLTQIYLTHPDFSELPGTEPPLQFE